MTEDAEDAAETVRDISVLLNRYLFHLCVCVCVCVVCVCV